MHGKICLLVASFSLAASVAPGSFGAPALKARPAPKERCPAHPFEDEVKW